MIFYVDDLNTEDIYELYHHVSNSNKGFHLCKYKKTTTVRHHNNDAHILIFDVYTTIGIQEKIIHMQTVNTFKIYNQSSITPRAQTINRWRKKYNQLVDAHTSLKNIFERLN